MSPTVSETALFLQEARRIWEMTTEEAAMLVHASRRSWEGWESGSRPIPRPILELFKSKLESFGTSRNKYTDLVVVVFNDQGWQEPIGVVSSQYFLGLENLGDGNAVIKSLAIDPTTKFPCVRKIKFNCADNEHVIRAASRWISVAEGS